jgi:hypothetical protein
MMIGRVAIWSTKHSTEYKLNVAPRTPRRGFILGANKRSTAALGIFYENNARNMLCVEIAALRTCSGAWASFLPFSYLSGL